VLIEAFAQRFQGLITRNPKHFTSVPLVHMAFPGMLSR
jgi:hypothetical protein